MKTLASKYLLAVLIVLTFIVSGPMHLFAEDAPTYRGKVVLVVDKTIASDPDVSWRIERLINDLTGDGWRVLRHDVDRGPVHPYDNINVSGYELWAAQNAPRVREVRALIKADYDAAPTEVKQVLLLGHVPVPYSGVLTNGPEVVGGHQNWGGAFPTDFFFSEMTAPYGPGGWSDSSLGSDVPVFGDPPPPRPYWEFTNSPGDGKFDQNYLPAPPRLAVGRIDLYNMLSFETNESTLIARYLNKDHDFRCANFLVQRRAFNGTDANDLIFLPFTGFQTFFGSNNVLSINTTGSSWFPYVSGATNDYLMGYGAGFGGPFGGVETVGTSADFAQTDSRVVFVNLYGSFIGLWDEPDDIMRAVLANPYDPANGKFGYGLTASFRSFGIDNANANLISALTNRTLGATIGEAMLNQTDINTNVGWSLMGDPTLRLHPVQQPGVFTIATNGAGLNLTWTASADLSATNYNIYRAPTPGGPFVLVNTNGVISMTNYTASRPGLGSDSDNFYMVRAVKIEQTPIGFYTNMAVGIVTNSPQPLTPYLAIASQPFSQTMPVHTADGITNSVAFSVDAVGCDNLGNPEVSYQWYEGTNALSDNGHYHGANSGALLISGLQGSDAGIYHVVVSNSFGVVTSSNALLAIYDPPIAVADSYTLIRATVTNLDVLVNDSDPVVSNLDLTLYSISSLSDTNAGTITVNSDQRTVHFVPAINWLGTVTFTYVVWNGTSSAQTNVTIGILPTPGDTPPSVSAIGPQQMAEDTTITIPFTVSDMYTSPSNLIYSLSFSDPSLIPNANLILIGSGASQVLQIRAAAHQIGSGTVTVTVTDYDGQFTNVTFSVTVTPQEIPTLLPEGFSGGGFRVSINGPAGSLVEIMQSDDLVNWISLGKVVLDGNIYNFVDSTANSTTQRFYIARGDNGCGVNTVGFINVTVPADSTNAVVNQLNNPLDNTIQTLFAGVPVGTGIYMWDPVAQSYGIHYGYMNSKGTLKWSPPATATLNPGQGFFLENPGSSSLTVTFVGDVPQGEQTNTGIPAVMGSLSLIGSIIPASGTLSSLGFPAAGGDIIAGANSAGLQVQIATYTNGGWNPVDPSMTFGQGFWIDSGSSTARNWTESFSPCSIQPVGVQPVLSDAQILSNAFSFSIASLAGSYWDVYESSDLTNWTLIAGVTLDAYGASSFTNDMTIVPYRFYRLSDGTCCSQSIGFTRIQVGAETAGTPGTNALIANQLYAPTNTLDGLFNVNGSGAMPDGVTLPDGSVVEKWNGVAYADYTWTQLAGWRDTNGSPAGTTILNPGDGAFLATSNAVRVTFVGLVSEGISSSLVQSNGSPGYVYSSILPRAGGLVTDLDYPPNFGDTIYIWTNGTFFSYSYINSKGTPKWIPNEPSVNVGQSYFIQTSTNKTWIQNLLGCSGQVVCSAPVLASAQILSNAFSFSATGPLGTVWSAYDSTNLTNWALIQGLTLNSSGMAAFTNNNIGGVRYRFYKLSDGTCCSQPIGFTRIPVGAGTVGAPGTNSFIANQLYSSTNTLDGLFNVSGSGTMPSGTALPDGSVVEKWNGVAYSDYTWTHLTGWRDTNGNPAGAITLNPGEGAFLAASNALTVTFVGLVGEGALSNPVQSGTEIYSSTLPRAGLLSSALDFSVNFGDNVVVWTNGTFFNYSYINSKGTPEWSPGEPFIDVGESFFIETGTNSTWLQNRSPCQ